MSRFDKDLIIVDEKLNPLTSEDSPIYSTLKYKKGIKNKIVGLKKNNKIKWFYINTNIIKSNSSEEIKGVILSFNDFTDLKEAIDTLEESDRFISTVLDSVEEGLLVTDENGKIETANNKIYNLFEFEKSSLIGRYINLIIDSEIFTFFTRDKSEFNLFGYKSDKSKFPIHISYSKATFQNKPIFIFVIRNLNPKIQLEKDFSENTFSEKEKEFREMTLNVPGVIFQFSVRDRNFHIEYISPKLKDIFGIKLSEDDFLFRNNKIQIYNKKYFLSNLISNIRRKLPINLELHFKSENKKDYYSNIIANPFILNTKDTIYNGVMIDITDSKETEKRLEEQRHLFRSLFNFSPIGKAIMDTEGGFYNSNIALHNIIGYNREELEYTNIFDLLEEPDKIKEKELLENFNNGKIHEIKLEHNIINKNKELKKIYRHMVSLLDEKGKLIFIICAFIDLTKQKNLEEKLTQNKKMESIGNFASSIAHDFNNLIQPILMYSGILKNDIKLNNIPDKKDLFEIIDKVHFSADRAKKLVSQILDFSKKGGKYHITLNLK
ncbi:MAG: PAS domain S-box protein, partial [Leptospiraceae bacterium]|nr:PAS domain S-box protein [Leptospiraceae bacterium]